MRSTNRQIAGLVYLTRIYVQLTIGATKSGAANALVRVDLIDTGGAIRARHRQTLILIQLTVGTVVAGLAQTLVARLIVDALQVLAVNAWTGGAVVDWLVASEAGEP